MADAVRAGPLLLLRRLREERAAVRVVTRHERGLRGVATGTLVAFDKHLNLVLCDVEESYTVLVRARRATAAGGERRAPKQERRTRRLKQVMLMGSGVVLVGAVGKDVGDRRREV
jgi:small nuclear ribonucleoprotein (snRNP)-like protein